MGFVALSDVLGAPQLCGTIQQTKTGIPNVLPAGIFPKDKTVEKDYGSYTRVNGTRTTARLAAYGGAAARRQLKGLEDVPVKLMHTNESIELPAADFRGLFRKDSTGSVLEIDEKGADEIARQVREARKNVDNLVVAAQTQALFKGAIYFDNAGNLLPNSTGAVTTPSFGVPAGNQGQLNWDGSGAIISASWATGGTNIASQILALKDAAIRSTGYELKYASYGSNIPGYLTNNTSLNQFFIRGNVANPQYLQTGEIPNPLLGLTWLPAHSAFYEDNNSVLQPLVGPNDVAFYPEPSLDWSGTLVGKYDVPGDKLVGASALELLASSQVMEGMFMYASFVLNPLRLELFYGHTFLPVIKANRATYSATVSGF